MYLFEVQIASSLNIKQKIMGVVVQDSILVTRNSLHGIKASVKLQVEEIILL